MTGETPDGAVKPSCGPVELHIICVLTSQLGDWFHDDLLQIVIDEPEEYTFEVDLTAIERFNGTIFDDLVERPHAYQSALGEFLSDYTSHAEWARWYAEADEDMADFDLEFEEPIVVPPVNAAVEFTNPPESITIDIGADNLDYIGELVAVEGVCASLSGRQPRRNEVVFRCQSCGSLQDPVDASWTTDLKKVEKEVGHCVGCERRSNYTIVSSAGEKVPYQQMKLQEPPQDATDSPQKIPIDMYDRDMHDGLEPGQRGTVIGVLEEATDAETTLVKTYIEAISLEANEKGHLDMAFTSRDTEKFEVYAEHPDFLNAAIRTVGKGIAGYENVKESLLLMAVGAPNRFDEQGELDTRGFGHVLLIGDPGTAKSALTKRLRRLAPFAFGASANSSTTVGLTASADKEELGGTEEWVVKSGALPMADGGILTIDELDNYSHEELSKLSDAMSEGEILVNKASVKANLRSYTSVVATANPIDGQFDEFEPYNDQFDMPDEILNRFDLVWVFRDVADPEIDERISEKIRDAHRNTTKAVADGSGETDTLFRSDGTVPFDELTRYIAYARDNFKPDLVAGSAADEALHEKWMQIRELGDKGRNAINPRKYHGFIRLAEASARIHLREEVTLEDVRRAERLLMSSLRDAAADKEGRIDINKLETGSTSIQQNARKSVMGHTRDLQVEYEDEPGAPIQSVIKRATDDFDKETVRTAIEMLKDDERLYEKEDGFLITAS